METLRQQLREKFPQAHGVRPDVGVAGALGMPIAVASFPLGAITEVVADGAGAGVLLLVAGLLGECGECGEVSAHPQVVLVDGADGFDPASFSGAACSRLLWVRCRSASDMLKAADWLAGDGNVPTILLDATGLARRDLVGLPASGWWRLKQGVARSGCRLVVLAPFPLVVSASLRLVLSAGLTLGDFDCGSDELRQRLRPVAQRLRHAT